MSDVDAQSGSGQRVRMHHGYTHIHTCTCACVWCCERGVAREAIGQRDTGTRVELEPWPCHAPAAAAMAPIERRRESTQRGRNADGGRRRRGTHTRNDRLSSVMHGTSHMHHRCMSGTAQVGATRATHDISARDDEVDQLGRPGVDVDHAPLRCLRPLGV